MRLKVYFLGLLFEALSRILSIILLFYICCILYSCLRPELPEVKEGVPEKLVSEAYSYVNNYRYWMGRRGIDDLYGFVCFLQGVAYSYGNKDTYLHFTQKIDAAGYPYCPDYWYQYTNYYKPGLHKEEYDRGTAWTKGAWEYLPKWAGIDCSGLVQRCAYAAGYNVPNIGNGEFNQWGGELRARDFVNYADKICDQSETNITKIKIGDIVLYGLSYEHIAIIVDTSGAPSIENIKVLHAYGGTTYDWSERVTLESEITKAGLIFEIWRLR